MTSPVRSRARRRWFWAVFGLLVLIAGVTAALPSMLSMPAAQRRMALEANKILAPSSVGFGAVRLSWFRPTEISNVVLKDAQGDTLVASPRATFGWSLWQLIVTRPKIADLTIEQGDIDIERLPDGTVDLYETLRPVISEHPPIRLKIAVEDGRLRYRDPAFMDPVVADKARVILDLGRNSEPITWDVELAKTLENAEVARLGLVGNYSRAQVDSAGRHDLTLAIKGARWPWTLASALVQARGELTGKIDGERVTGRVRIAGDATVTNLLAMGDLLSTDTVHLDTVTAKLNVAGSDASWSIDKLDVTSPVAHITGQGSIPPTRDKAAWLEASVDLPVVARQLRATLHLRDDLRVQRGAAQLRADARLNADGHTEDWNVTGKISDLAARLGSKALALPEPATLVAKLERDKTTTTLERLDVQTSFMTASGRGDLDKGIAVAATLDLAAFRERFRDWIDLGQLELAGHGRLDALYKRQGQEYRASLNASFRDLRIAGLPLVDKVARDQATIEGTLVGRSTAAGWPVSWNDASLRALSGESELAVSAQAGAGPGELAVTGRAKLPLPGNGLAQRLEADLKAKSSQQGSWQTERLALAVLRASKWGPGIGPEEAIRWEGTGHYDARRDELKIESLARAPRPPVENETWITGNQSLRASGVLTQGAAQIELAGGGELKPLGRWLAPAEPPWSGQYEALVRGRRDGERWDLGTRVDLRDPQRASGDMPAMGLAGNVALAMNAVYTPRSDLLEMTELTVKSPQLQLDGGGKVRSVTTRAVVDLKGSLDLDWEAIGARLAREVEPNARISGRSRGWRIAGTIDGLPAFDRMGSLEGEIGVQIDSLDVFGMRLSEAPIVVRAADGRLTIDPIDSKLNGGLVHLEPELVRGKDGSTWLHLGPASKLDGADVNDEVSHRVLSFAAPVLDGATRVDGRVSVALADAYFPIVAPAGALARIQGNVLFDDVRLMPGALADQLLSVFQLERKPLAVLRDPVEVRIAGRKVYSRGLTIPVVNLASIGLEGSVDFDQNLDLVARFALIPPRSNVPVLTPLMSNAHFDLPIRGTLKHPKIDGEALKDRWAAIGAGLLGNTMDAGVNGLQRLLQGLPVPGLRGLLPPGRRAAPPPAAPRLADPGVDDGDVSGEKKAPRTDHDVLKPPPDAPERPRPLTQAERKQRREKRRQERLQKKAERRAERDPQSQ